MSLIKQLWIAIALITVLSLGGSFVVSTLSARHYLQQELAVKNMDNATSLALSLSQMPKDPVTVELQLAAQFDAGHYSLIRLTAPTGDTLAERRFEGPVSGAPEWLIRLVPIATRPGIAQVQDGWRQFGTLQVETHTRYAYESLWNATRQLFLWFIGGGLLTGLIGTVALKLITRPLDRMVEQAQAIGDRRFITTPEPHTLEFRSVVRALNTLSDRVRAMLAEEAQRLELLRRQTQYDELTGLYNRSQFLKQLDAALAKDDDAAGGTLIIVRLHNLAALNQELGRQGSDRLIVAVTAALQTFAASRGGWECGRLNAADFALLAPGADDPHAIASALLASLPALDAPPTRSRGILLAAGQYTTADRCGALLARLDGTLATIEQDGGQALGIAATAPTGPRHASLDDWRRVLDEALDARRIELGHFPVLDRDGALLHQQAPVRLKFDGDWWPAGVFLPWAARLGMLSRIDALVVETACARLARDPGVPAQAINVSAESLRSTDFRDALLRILHAHPAVAPRLWVEVQESSALKYPVEFRALCLALRPLGCKLGLKNAGQRFSRFTALHDLGLDYIKIGAALIRDIGDSPGNQAFVRALCTVAHSIGLAAIAEGVDTGDEARCLLELGIDGLTGPGIVERPGHEKTLAEPEASA